MASSIPIVTLSQVKDYLGLPDNYSDVDAIIDDASTGLIDVCSGEIEKYLGTKVYAQTVTAYLNGSGLAYQEVPMSPIVSVTSVQYRTVFNGSWTDLFTSSDYYFTDPLTDPYKIVGYQDAFPSGERNIKIVYVCGWSSIPTDIQRVCLEMVAMMYKESKMKGPSENTLGKASVSASGANASGSTSYLEMWDRWARVLDRYRRIQV